MRRVFEFFTRGENGPSSVSTRNEKGFTVGECLIALIIMSVGTLAMASTAIQSSLATKRAIRSQYALQLAQARLEWYAAIDPSTLTADATIVENDLMTGNVEFTRSSFIVINEDNSRTITVRVRPEEQSLGGEVALTSTFPLWGNV
jgi:Tfp pilus assembly protein PilV